MSSTLAIPDGTDPVFEVVYGTFTITATDRR